MNENKRERERALLNLEINSTTVGAGRELTSAIAYVQSGYNVHGLPRSRSRKLSLSRARVLCYVARQRSRRPALDWARRCSQGSSKFSSKAGSKVTG